MATIDDTQKKRVRAYIDGWNLYRGLRDMGWRRYYWLDLVKLVSKLLRSDEVLVQTNYYTTVTTDNPGKKQRHDTYISAIRTRRNIRITFGRFMPIQTICPKCGGKWRVLKEKCTDVNIALDILHDAHTNSFDTAILISADSDLSGAITMAQSAYNKRIIVVFPPKRYSGNLAKIADHQFSIKKDVLHKSMLPDEILLGNTVLKRPDKWKENIEVRSEEGE